MSRTEGHCLCGAVRIAADLAATMSACHCDMCRRWSGSIQMGIEASAPSVRVTGPVRTYHSTAFSERAWCAICGSALWLRDLDGPYELVPGLFDNAAGARLTREVYADCCPDGYRLAGRHERISRDEYERTHRHLEGRP